MDTSKRSFSDESTILDDNQHESTTRQTAAPFEWTMDNLDAFCQMAFPNMVVRRTWTQEGEYVTVKKNAFNVAYLSTDVDEVLLKMHQRKVIVHVEEGRTNWGWLDFTSLLSRQTRGQFYEEIESALAAFEEKPDLKALEAYAGSRSPYNCLFGKTGWMYGSLIATILALLLILALYPSSDELTGAIIIFILSLIWAGYRFYRVYRRYKADTSLQDNSFVAGFPWTMDILDKFCQMKYPKLKVRRTYTRDGECISVHKNIYNIARIRIVDDHDFYLRLGKLQSDFYIDIKRGQSGPAWLFGGFFLSKLTRGNFYEMIERDLNNFAKNPHFELLENAGFKESPRSTAWIDKKWSKDIILYSIVLHLILIFVFTLGKSKLESAEEMIIYSSLNILVRYAVIIYVTIREIRLVWKVKRESRNE